MTTASPSLQVYPIVKISTVAQLLVEEGVGVEAALAGTGLTGNDLSSTTTRVSIGQMITCYRNAMGLTRDPWFAYHAGHRFHLSSYGLYGFAMLSSPSFRETYRFSVRYHRLAMPLCEISFEEREACAAWNVVPLAHPLVDAALYRFLVELQCATQLSLQRDFMGASFNPDRLCVTYSPPANAADYPAIFGCPVRFDELANSVVFDSSWLDRPAELGNRIVFPTVVALCDALLKELDRREGVAGKVRGALLARAPRPANFEEIASDLALSPRTLRRRLGEEHTSYRKLMDELRAELAIRYVRETDLSVDEIASTLGFSEPAAFRHAFRRWTKAAPSRFRLPRKGRPPGLLPGSPPPY
jgi:AraC-like DNA-binding protein